MNRSRLLISSLLFTASVFAQSADLNVQGNLTRNADHDFVLFAMTNNGPDAASNAVLTVDVPAGLTIRRFSYGAGDVVDKPCDLQARPIRCQVGNMHVGAPFHYGGIEIVSPLADAVHTVKFTLTSGTPDPKLSNNTSSVTWETTVEADLTARVTPVSDPVDPGQTAEFSVVVCNTVRGNLPPAVRLELTPANGRITDVTPSPAWSCTVDGSMAVCTVAQLPWGCTFPELKVQVQASADRRGGELTLTASAMGNIREKTPADNQHAKSVPIYRWLSVGTTADSGPGSLRAVIGEANASCSPGPCRIVFEIPPPVPAEGWFTITPSTPLPSITAERVALEGTRQTAFTGDTNPKGPEIAIDGRHAGRGIRMLALCEGVVEGLAIGNFDDDQGLWVSTGGACSNRSDRRLVSRNHIGVDPSGQVPWPNRRGLRADFSIGLSVTKNVIAHNRFSGIWQWRGNAMQVGENVIEKNGASGVFLGPEVPSAGIYENVIRDHREMGLALAAGANAIAIRRNSMKDNGGLGIDWGLDGVSPTGGDDHHGPTNAPVLLSATYVPARNVTEVVFTIRSSPLGPYFNFGAADFFSNDGPDGDGERFIQGVQYVTSFDGTITMSVPGDHGGKWINATWTREHQYGARNPGTQSHETGFVTKTSELSNTVLVR